MLSKHPQGLWVLFFTEMWERFGYYLMLGIFVLYMTDAERGGLGFGTTRANDIYGWEPLGVIAGSSELRMHSLGQDVWEVWVCDTPDGDVAVDPAEVVRVLNAEIGPFYRWLSGNAYQPDFRPGGTVEQTAGCAAAVADVVTTGPNGVIIVTDTSSNGGSAQSGLWCPYEGQCPRSPVTYPDNYRSVTLGAHAVVGPNPRLPCRSLGVAWSVAIIIVI